MRLFISINLSEHSLLRLEELQEILKHKGVEGYWRKRDNLHLTLKFLGEIKQKDYHALHQKLAEAQRKIGEFTLLINTLGVFPDSERPRILWAGIKYESKLIQLQQKIEELMLELGIPKESRRYVPHLTMASGGIRGIDQTILAIGKSLLLEETVSTYCLMNSVVAEGKRKYVTMETYIV